MSSPARGATPPATTAAPVQAPADGAASTQSAKKPTKRATKKAAKIAEPIPAAATAQPRRHTLVLRRVGLLSVLKVSIAFYLASVAMFVVALFALWLIAGATGIIDNLEELIAELFAYDEFRFVSWELLRAVLVLGVVWTALATTLTMIAAAFYNIFSGMLGGVEMTLDEQA